MVVYEIAAKAAQNTALKIFSPKVRGGTSGASVSSRVGIPCPANHVRASVSQLKQPAFRIKRTVTKSISWLRQKGVRMYRDQPIQRPKKMGMLMYPVRKFWVFHTKKTW